jgi:hypothetical protein
LDEQKAKSTGTPKEITFDDKRPIIKALLACSSLNNSQTRESIINQLPCDIRDNVFHTSNARIDVANLVNTCLNYSHGLHKLIEILDFYEGTSNAMQHIQQLIGSHVKQH